MSLAGPAHVLLNLAVGGSSWAGRYGVNETAFPQSFEIDWVRVFKPIDISNNSSNVSVGNSSMNGNRALNSSIVESAGSPQAIRMTSWLLILLSLFTLFHHEQVYNKIIP